MNEQTVRALNAINRRFYGAHADDFARARAAPWPGWLRVLPHLAKARRAAPEGPLRVLDVGCGHARFGAFLGEHVEPDALEYWGIDASEALLALARRRALGFARSELRCVDVVEQPRALPQGPFSLVALFGVLHHVPSRARRSELLRAIGERLAPTGILALTCWQLEALERLRQRQAPWREYNSSTAEPIDERELEPGDLLLRWGDQDGVLRYCHSASEADTRRLLEGARLRVVDSYAADGLEASLNRYFICRFSNAQVRPKRGPARG